MQMDSLSVALEPHAFTEQRHPDFPGDGRAVFRVADAVFLQLHGGRRHKVAHLHLVPIAHQRVDDCGYSLRFFIVAALLWKFGAPIRDFIERRLGLMFILFVILLAGGFYVVKFL